MRCVILAAGRFDEALKAEIAAGRAPRLDMFELARELDADIVDFNDVARSSDPSVRLAARVAGNSAALALLGFKKRALYDTFLTSGEDIGLPLSLLAKATPKAPSITTIAHTLLPAKKQAFFRVARVGSALDRVLVHSTSEERLAVDALGLPAAKVVRLNYQADQRFFRPDITSQQEPDLICAAGQLLRDYDCLLEAVRDLPLRVQIAAGSPWIEQPLKPRAALPANVTWGKLDRYELRALYARSAFAVVPILQNHYQTGIATILEMMAMGKCVIATRTHGQTDTIVDGVTGIYVPPGDPLALRAAIRRLIENPQLARAIGDAARKFVDEQASLDLFVERLAAAVREGHAARFG